jgi:hypothetical protein
MSDENPAVINPEAMQASQARRGALRWLADLTAGAGGVARRHSPWAIITGMLGTMTWRH